jgi:hypothetical protein
MSRQPEGCTTPHRFATVRRKVNPFETRGFIACDQNQRAAALTAEWHHLKGGKKRFFDEGLNGMGLPHPARR